MVARINTVAFQGIDVRPIDVQVQISSGLVAFTIVGLPDKAVAESRERVRSALHAMGLSLPPKRLTVNLAPADVAKEGSHYDLPIALGVLCAMGVFAPAELQDYVVLGELGLDAGLRAVTGVLPAAVYASGAGLSLICPKSCGGEAAWAGEDLEILAPANMLQLLNHIKGTQLLVRPEAKLAQDKTLRFPDLRDVKGQETARRALEIAAAGGHNMLMMGAPGSGKSLLSACLPTILPPLSASEALEVSMIHSLAGTLPQGGLIAQRPYRDPHHSASLPALVGGGQRARPGELSLAHRGVLFLDELPEFSRPTLEALRQPLETGRALIARVHAHVSFPARVQLICAMNPCRCGWLGDPTRACTRAPRCALDYQAKISGPLLDRIDLQVDVPPVRIQDLAHAPAGEASAQVAERVARARHIQTQRYSKLDPEHGADCLNAHAQGKILEEAAPLEPEAASLLHKAAERLHLSARSYYRMIRVARTIADLDDAPSLIRASHLAEALTYRRLQIEP